MSLGTLIANEQIRSIPPKVLVQHFNLDIKIDGKENATYQKYFPQSKVPAFIGPKGFKLSELIAITVYLVKLAGQEAKFLGKNDQEFAEVLKWISFAGQEFMETCANTFQPLIGKQPYNKKKVDDSGAYLEKVVSVFEDRLANYTYLVGERVSLADIVASVLFVRGFDYLFGKDWRKKHPNTTRWFKTLMSHEMLQERYGDYKFRDAPVEFTPPKKEKKETPAKKEAPAKKETPAEPAPAAAPKPKHPLEALGKSKTPVDEWKRVYSNEETRETAIPWFWKNMFDPSEWSLWKVDYKYNDELTLTFMSNNLVGGFFNRLSASTKYMFGCMVVYGENNNNGITGFLMVRGQEVEPAVNVAPDWESYAFTKLDHEAPETKKFVDNMLAWDEPVDVNGESKEIADGKVLK